MDSAGLIDHARNRIDLLDVPELRRAGLIPAGGLYYPTIYYPPVPIYRAADEAAILEGLEYDGIRCPLPHPVPGGP